MYVKVCGITRPAEIALLEALPVTLVGLWHGVRGGHADLSLIDCQRLVATADATHSLEPVLVTFLNDAEELREVVHCLRVRWIDCTGTKLLDWSVPSSGQSQKVCVIKVLHVHQGHCLEVSLVGAYEKAGVDVFLFDAVTDDGRIGSTGRPLDNEVVTVLAKRLTRPFLLAGGVNVENWREHANVIRDPRWLGIDLDTNARGRDGRLRPENIDAIVQAWAACVDQGSHHVQ